MIQSLILVFIFINCIFHTVDAKLTEDKFSDITIQDGSFKDDIDACLARIAEEMCDGQKDTIPTPESILKFIASIQTYIDKLKYTQTITPENLNVAKIAILDVAKARKMLSLRTPADILNTIRNAIDRIDLEVTELENYIKHKHKSDN